MKRQHIDIFKRIMLTGIKRLNDFKSLVTSQEEPWLDQVQAVNLDSTLRVSLGGVQAESWREALVELRVRAARLELGDEAPEGLHIKLLR